MSDSPWESRLKALIKRSSEELRRFGDDVKDEAQRLLKEVQDPERQAQLKEGLKEVGTWARKAAEDVATVVEEGVKKAEDAIQKAGRDAARTVDPTATPPSPPPVHVQAAAPPAPAPAPEQPAAKTVGPAATRQKPTEVPRVKKTIGRRPSSAEEE